MTINWDVFYIFTIISVILWIISSVASATRNGQKRNIQNCCCHRHGRMYSLFRIYHRPVDLSAKATAQNNGRNQIMVFTIHGNIGAYHLLEMEIQMDTLLLHFGIDSVLHYQHTQT